MVDNQSKSRRIIKGSYWPGTGDCQRKGDESGRVEPDKFFVLVLKNRTKVKTVVKWHIDIHLMEWMDPEIEE